MRHFGITVSRQVDQGQPLADAEKVQAACTSRRFADSRQVFPSGQSIQKRAFADVRASSERDFDAIPARACGDCQSRAHELRVKPHLMPLAYAANQRAKVPTSSVLPTTCPFIAASSCPAVAPALRSSF